MVRTLHHRVRMVINEEEDRALEVVHINHAFGQFRYPAWAVGRGAAPPKEKDSTHERETEEWEGYQKEGTSVSPIHQGPLRGAGKDP